jgi:hypothetical protein
VRRVATYGGGDDDAGLCFVYVDGVTSYNMSVIFMSNYFFNRSRYPVNSEMFLVIDFMNLKIMPTQSFRCTKTDALGDRLRES